MLPKSCDVELTQAFMASSMDGLLVAGGLVTCPFCGGDDMRLRRERVYHRRSSDSQDGALFDSAAFPPRMHPSAMRENPSKHRSGLRLNFHCKHCLTESCLLIVQEGLMGERTVVAWDSEEPFEAVCEPESAKTHASSRRVFVMTTWRTGKGEEDFAEILRRRNHTIHDVVRIDWMGYEDQALTQAIHSHWDQFGAGDIVAIVRGGGDTNDPRFSPFRAESAAKAITLLREKKAVLVVTGVGHASDHFLVEQSATFAQATPTDAAYKVCELLEA